MLVGKVKGKDEQGDEVREGGGEVLLLSPASEAYNVTGGDIRDCDMAAISQANWLRLRVAFFRSTRQVAVKFGRLTGEHVPVGDFKYKLAIVQLDNVLQTAPNLISQISPITGASPATSPRWKSRRSSTSSTPAACPLPWSRSLSATRSSRAGSGHNSAGQHPAEVAFTGRVSDAKRTGQGQRGRVR